MLPSDHCDEPGMGCPLCGSTPTCKLEQHRACDEQSHQFDLSDGLSIQNGKVVAEDHIEKNEFGHSANGEVIQELSNIDLLIGIKQVLWWMPNSVCSNHSVWWNLQHMCNLTMFQFWVCLPNATHHCFAIKGEDDRTCPNLIWIPVYIIDLIAQRAVGMGRVR